MLDLFFFLASNSTLNFVTNCQFDFSLTFLMYHFFSSLSVVLLHHKLSLRRFWLHVLEVHGEMNSKIPTFLDTFTHIIDVICVMLIFWECCQCLYEILNYHWDVGNVEENVVISMMYQGVNIVVMLVDAPVCHFLGNVVLE